MDNLLIFFALPLATIIIAVVLERIWKCYKLVTAFIFAIFLIVTFVAFDASFLVYALIYTILAFIASYLSMLARRISKRFNETNCSCENNNNWSRRRDGYNRENCNCEAETNGNNLLTISSSCGNGDTNELLTINTNCSRGSNEENNNECNEHNTEVSSNFAITANVIPNTANNGRTGSFRGCYRRRC